MKVICEKDYLYVGIENGWYKFISNPDKVRFDPEILLVKRVRYILKTGGNKFFDYIA